VEKKEKTRRTGITATNIIINEAAFRPIFKGQYISITPLHTPVGTLSKLTNKNKHIKLGNMVTYATGTKKRKKKTKEKSQSTVINTAETARWIGCLRTLLTVGGGGLLVENKSKKEINITLQTEGLKKKKT
jgi:hypothetical protein